MKGIVEERAVELGEYILENRTTVRGAAKKFGISKKENLRDCFSEEELKSIQSMENLVSGLVDCGWDYDKVKAFIENTNTKHLQIA